LKVCVIIGVDAAAMVAVMATLPPLHILAVVGAIVIVPGFGRKPTVVVTAVLQVPLVAEKVYVLAADGVTTLLKDVEVYPEGPVQEYVGAVVAPVIVTGEPGHTGPLLVAEIVNGQSEIIFAT